MTALGRSTAVDCDALIVGGGPVGLALAIGLQQRGLQVLVLEKAELDPSPHLEQNRNYVYRVDRRGVACLSHLRGLDAKLPSVGAPHTVRDCKMWKQDGSLTYVNTKIVLPLGYFVHRPALLGLLEAELSEGTIIRGTLQNLDLIQNLDLSSTWVASVRRNDGVDITIASTLTFGCDGVKSRVREVLLGIGAGFVTREAESPSSGMVYKSMLFAPPEEIKPMQMHLVEGVDGTTLCMLPMPGKPGELRPLGQPAHPDAPGIMQQRFAPDLLAYLDKNFPQLEAAKRISAESREAFATSRGTVFPKLTWCTRASYYNGSCGAALLGDALHAFPPDLGFGVNAGLWDVLCLLQFWPSASTTKGLESNELRQCLASYEASQVPEAEAVCNLIPEGMPYQYRQPKSLGQVCFMLHFVLTLLASKLCPCLIDPPVAVLATTRDPPLKFSEVLRRHRKRLWLMRGMAFLVVAGGCYGLAHLWHLV